MERRNFNQLFALGSLGLAFSSPITNKKISLAQWSLHRAIKINKELSPNDFSIFILLSSEFVSINLL